MDKAYYNIVIRFLDYNTSKITRQFKVIHDYIISLLSIVLDNRYAAHAKKKQFRDSMHTSPDFNNKSIDIEWDLTNKIIEFSSYQKKKK